MPAPLITRPGEIVCTDLGYVVHIGEVGHERPEVPTLFAKFVDAITDAKGNIRVPEICAEKLDYGGRLAVIVDETRLRVSEEQAQNAAAGYAIMNDFTQRGSQYATTQWLQGKTLRRISAFGPWMLTTGVFDAGFARVHTYTGRELRWDMSVVDPVFLLVKLIAHILQFMQLNPDDVISTGTPAGAGHGMSPQTYLRDGQEAIITIDSLGKQVNTIRINHQHTLLYDVPANLAGMN